jgi:hypothetical protein
MKFRPKLIPLAVNWSISPSTPRLRVCVTENSLEPTEAEFFAYDQNDKEFRVTLAFQNGIWVAFSPSYADDEVVQEDAYDWSAVFTFESIEKFNSDRIRFRELWKQSGTCPNPAAYEVQGSLWLEQLRVGKNNRDSYKHFLLLGHDSYAEIIAEDWSVARCEEITWTVISDD